MQLHAAAAAAPAAAQPAAAAAPAPAPAPAQPRGPPLAPLVERVGLLVALCPAMQQLSIGCGSAAVLRAIERHEALQQIVIYGETHQAGASGSGGAAAAAAAAPVPQHPRQPQAPGVRAGGAPRAGANSGAAAAAIDGHAWGLLRRGLPRLGRLTFMDSDLLLGGSPSPAVPLLALAEGSAVGELRLLKYSSLTDEGLAVATLLMAGVRTLALGGCTVRGWPNRQGRLSRCEAWAENVRVCARAPFCGLCMFHALRRSAWNFPVAAAPAGLAPEPVHARSPTRTHACPAPPCHPSPEPDRYRAGQPGAACPP
jgi:hypothetical protein